MKCFYLILGSLAEVGSTTTLGFANGFRDLLATAAFLLCFSLGTAYAIWTGIGPIGTVEIGIIRLGEPATVLRGLLITATIGCAMGLKLTAGQQSCSAYS